MLKDLRLVEPHRRLSDLYAVDFPAFAVFLANKLSGFGTVGCLESCGVPFPGLAGAIADVAEQYGFGQCTGVVEVAGGC